MKKLGWLVGLLFGLIIIVPFTADATPPSDIQITYNSGLQSLEISMRHVSIEVREHYIRTLRITVNDGEEKVFRYPFQKSPKEFSALIPLSLNPGDKVTVKAECKLGGHATAELILPQADPTPSEEVSIEEGAEVIENEEGK